MLCQKTARRMVPTSGLSAGRGERRSKTKAWGGVRPPPTHKSHGVNDPRTLGRTPAADRAPT